MSSLELILWITAAIALQVAIYLGALFWKHWRGYTSLLKRARDADIDPTERAAEDSGAAPASPAWSGWRAFRIERRAVEDARQTICSFYLVPQDGQALPSYLPGQFLTFRFEVPTAGGATESIVRCYTLSDAPHPGHYRISVKRQPAPAGQDLPPGRSSTFLHDHVQVGSVLQVRAPSGHFHIDDSDTPVVLIGGGIGITPMLSMLNACLAKRPQREVWLFYGVRDGSELVMLEHLQAQAAAHASFQLRLCFSAPLPEDLGADPSRCQGRVDVKLLRMHLPLKPYHFYICGPSPMMESLVPALEDWGVPEARIHYETFGPASIPRRDKTATSAQPASAISVNFARSGKQVVWQPEQGSLLEFALAHGVAIASGCRAGACGSCQTSIASGRVTYRQTPDFDPAPGGCLMCVCVPESDLILEA